MTTFTTHGRGRRAAVAAAAIALSTLTLFGFAGIASAAPIGDIDNINSPDALTGQLVITKYEKTAGNGTVAGDGTVQVVTGPTIDGVTFQLDEIVATPGNTSLDLLTNAGWTQAEAIESAWSAAAPTTLPVGYTLNNIGTQLTAGGGIATFGSATPGAGLHYGLYLVREVSPSPANITDPALPFLVTIPFPTGTVVPANTNEWLYQVHVYPKNGVTDLTKQVITTDASFYTQASYVSWTVNSDVPILATGDHFTLYKLSDTIDITKLNFLAVAATPPAGVSDYAVRAYAAGSATPLAGLLTSMYTIDETNSATGTLVVEFNASGRTFLEANAQGGKIELDVPTRVLAADITPVVNNVQSFVNSSTLNANANQDFGQLRIFKFANTTGTAPNPKTPIVGAKFQLYKDANADNKADAGELVTINGVNEWTVTALTGILDISGVKPGAYMLVESAAPAGYATPVPGAPGDLGSTTNPYLKTVVAGAANAGTGVNYQEVANFQLPPWALPFTGGNGVLTFTLIGIALMALAFGLAFVAFRRQSKKS